MSGVPVTTAKTLLVEEPPEHDQWGRRALAIMLADLPFPRTRKELADRAGTWRLPMPGRRALRLGDLFKDIPDRIYASPRDAVRAVVERWPEVAEAHGPWRVPCEPMAND